MKGLELTTDQLGIENYRMCKPAHAVIFLSSYTPPLQTKCIFFIY